MEEISKLTQSFDQMQFDYVNENNEYDDVSYQVHEVQDSIN